MAAVAGDVERADAASVHPRVDRVLVAVGVAERVQRARGGVVDVVRELPERLLLGEREHVAVVVELGVGEERVRVRALAGIGQDLVRVALVLVVVEITRRLVLVAVLDAVAVRVQDARVGPDRRLVRVGEQVGVVVVLVAVEHAVAIAVELPLVEQAVGVGVGDARVERERQLDAVGQAVVVVVAVELVLLAVAVAVAVGQGLGRRHQPGGTRRGHDRGKSVVGEPLAELPREDAQAETRRHGVAGVEREELLQRVRHRETQHLARADGRLDEDGARAVALEDDGVAVAAADEVAAPDRELLPDGDVLGGDARDHGRLLLGGVSRGCDRPRDSGGGEGDQRGSPCGAARVGANAGSKFHRAGYRRGTAEA